MKDLLAIDVGNTSVHFAYYAGSRWKGEFRIPTKDIQAKAAGILKRKFKNNRMDAVIGSVVPKTGKFL